MAHLPNSCDPQVESAPELLPRIFSASLVLPVTDETADKILPDEPPVAGLCPIRSMARAARAPCNFAAV